MYRYEKKFKLASKYYRNIKNQIELKGWFKQYPDRLINNIYLDNLSNSCFYDSIEGHLSKKKYRIRWYGRTFTENKQKIKKSNFEIKIKRDDLNYKKTFHLEEFLLPKKIIFSDLLLTTTNLLKRNVDELEYLYIENFEPFFMNSYFREYYIDLSGDIRLTIDRKQKFYDAHPMIFNYVKNNDIIIELKFKSKISYNNFVIKSNLAQNSKFTNGINSLFNLL